MFLTMAKTLSETWLGALSERLRSCYTLVEHWLRVHQYSFVN